MYLIFFLIWVIFNGQFTPEIAVFGLIIAGLMYAFICKFMGYKPRADIIMAKKFFYLIQYVFILVKEIVKANFTAIHMILSEEEEVEPVLVSFSSDMKTDLGKAFLANAITLTPGTITVMLENSEFVVHCLDKSLAAGMDSSVFVQLLKKLETDKEEK